MLCQNNGLCKRQDWVWQEGEGWTSKPAEDGVHAALKSAAVSLQAKAATLMGMGHLHSTVEIEAAMVAWFGVEWVQQHWLQVDDDKQNEKQKKKKKKKSDDDAFDDSAEPVKYKPLQFDTQCAINAPTRLWDMPMRWTHAPQTRCIIKLLTICATISSCDDAWTRETLPSQMAC